MQFSFGPKREVHTHTVEINSVGSGITCKFIVLYIFENNLPMSNKYLA